MVLKKDPENLPDDVVDFVDVYSDINTPQYWIAKSDSDLTTRLLVLDGHSTIISYQKDTEELHWEAIHELGQYAYQPDSIGDGLIVFPHTFHLEFEIELTDKKLKVSVNFDGTGVRAIIMPFKDVTIDNFMSSFSKRISSIFTSVLKPADDRLGISEGEPLRIPESVESSLSLKLALMGINIQKVKVESITNLEIKEDDIQEEVFEVPEKLEEPEEIEVEEKEITHAESTPKEEPTPVAPPPKQTPPGPPPPKAKNVKADKSSGGPPSVPSSSSADPPRPGGIHSKTSSGPPAPSSSNQGGGGAPPPGPPKPGMSKQQTAKPSSQRARSDAKKSRRAAPPLPTSEVSMAEEEVDDIDGLLDDVLGDEPDDIGSLIARGMDESTKSSASLRQTHITWFDRMVPNRAYKLAIKISTTEMKAKKSVTNVVSGERRTEVTDTMVVDEKTKLVIRPDFPGCIVIPSYQEFDASEDNIRADFHVTPLAIGQLESRIVFLQNGEEIHNIDLETKVIKHRVAKWTATLGAVTGSLPAVLAFLFNETPNEFLGTRLETFGFLTSIGYLLPILVSGVFFAIAGAFYYTQQPNKSDKEVSFPR